MLSEQKILLRVAEVIVICSTVAALWISAQVFWKPDPDFPVFLAACAGMAALLLTFLPACMLAGEYVRTVRKPGSWRERTEGLSSSEISAVVKWAPRSYLCAACIGVLIAVCTAIRFGSITFSETQSINSESVVGLGLYFSVFFLLALPVLGSAARMQGTYPGSNA